MLTVSITILTVLLVVVCLLIILLVLMQRPKQEGLGAAFGGGMMNDIAGAHTTDILQKGTVWMSVLFFSISILLGILYTQQLEARNNVKVLDGVKQEQLPPGLPPSISDLPSPISIEQTPTPGGEAPSDSPSAPASESETPEAPAEKEKGNNAPDPAPDASDEKVPDDKPEPPKTESEEAKKPAESGNPQ